MDCPGNSPGQNTGVGSLSLLQGIFPIHGSNSGLLNYRRILYQLSHKGSPRILEWVAYPFFSRYSQPRNQTGVSCIAGEFFYQLSYQGSQAACKKLFHILLKFIEFHYRKMYKKFLSILKEVTKRKKKTQWFYLEFII